MWAAYMGLIVFAHVWSYGLAMRSPYVFTHSEPIYRSTMCPTLGSCGQPIWVWLCLLMCDSYGLAMRSPLCLPIQNPYTDQPCVLPWAMWAAYMGLIVFAHVWLIWVGHEVPYVFTHSEPIYRSTMWVLPWAHVGSIYGSDCVCSCVTHMGWPWGPICVYPFRTHIQINHVSPTLGSCGQPYMGLIVFAHVWLIWVGHEVPICVYPFRTHIQINHVSPTLGHVGSLYGSDCVCSCVTHMGWPWGPICVYPFRTHIRSTMCVLPWAHVGSYMGLIVFAHVWLIWVGHEVPYVFTHSEPIYRSTMWVLPWAHVGSIYGSDCVCSCVTHMGWPWGPHMCLPIQNPYTDQPCESYLGLMWAAYMGLIVFAHVWLIWVGHEVPICVYPFRTHIQINHVCPTLGSCGQPIWVWLCLLMCDSYGLAMRSPYVFTHSEPIDQPCVSYLGLMWQPIWSDCVCSCVTHMGWPWGPHMCLPIQNPYTDQPCESYLGLMGSIYGSDCVCSCVTHMGWPWGPHMCLPIQNPYTDQPCESYLGHMWAAYMGLIVFAHVWLIWVGHEVPICVYPFRTHIQINHVCPTLGSCGHLYGSDCVCSCVTHMGWPWGPHMCLPIQNPYKDQRCESYLGPICVAYMRLIVFAHVRTIWVVHEGPTCDTHLAPIHLFPINDPYGTYIGSPLLLAHVGPI